MQLLNRLLSLLESAAPSLVTNERDVTFVSLRSAGLLRKSATAKAVSCPSCDDGRLLHVLRPVEDDSGRRTVVCPECGVIDIDPSAMLRWTVDGSAFARCMKRGLPYEGNLTARIADRLWRLGRMSFGCVDRDIYLARGLTREDADRTVWAQSWSRSDVVIVTATPPSEPGLLVRPATVEVSEFVCWADKGPVADHGALERAIVAADAIADRLDNCVKLADIEAIVEVAVERQAEYTPNDRLALQLAAMGGSSRAIEEELRKRKIEMDHASIARLIKRAKESGLLERVAAIRESANLSQKKGWKRLPKNC